MQRFFIQTKKQKDKGFTLVELLIAMTVFVFIVTFCLGSIVSILDAGRKARSLKAVMTNMNLTGEVMSREIKFGTHYYCGISSTFPPPAGADCTGSSVPPGSALSFVTSDGQNVIYKLASNQIQKSTDNGATYLGITSPDVVVTDLKFYVFNSRPQSDPSPDNAQPRVTIIIKGYAGSANRASVQSSFDLETTVSQRTLDR